MRTIDADALKKYIDAQEGRPFIGCTVGEAMKILIDEQPTVQPEPQEGHWIEGEIYRDAIECNCSECGQLMTTAATVRMNFCPNCGARMTR